jgi:two-component system, LytTR family, response regulator
MRALIADDEAPARAKLRRLLEASNDIEIVGEASTGREAVALIKRSQPDVAFLDIRMPGLDGFGVLDSIASDEAPYVVFVTANEQHAIRAFEVGAVDYLLKPYTPERFERVLDRARDRFALGARSTAQRGHAGAPEYDQPRAFLRRLLVMDNGRAVFLPTDRIDRIEAERNYVHVFCGKAKYRLRATIGALQDRLDPGHFLRVNRSTLVRLDAMQDVHEWSHGDFRVVMNDGAELVWSRRYRAAAEREFGIRG